MTPVTVYAHDKPLNSVDAIRQALEISRLLGTGVVLQKPVSAWLLPDEIGGTGSMVVIAPRDRQDPEPADPDRTGSNLASAAILAAAGGRADYELDFASGAPCGQRVR